jgi:hypothetical protein
MVILLVGAEVVLPGWWRMFAEAIAQDHQYTQSQSVLQVILNAVLGSVASGNAGRIGGQILAAISVLACGPILWKLRRAQAETTRFNGAATLALALTVMVARDSPYNQVLLLPAILLLVRDRRSFLSRPRGIRFGYLAGIFALTWQWIASVTLSVAYLLGVHAWALGRWQWPFFATFALPVLVFVLVFLDVEGKLRQFRM